jgi:hypothetical protein
MQEHLPVERDYRMDSLAERAAALATALSMSDGGEQRDLLARIRRRQVQLLANFGEGVVYHPEPAAPLAPPTGLGAQAGVDAIAEFFALAQGPEGLNPSNDTMMLRMTELLAGAVHRPVHIGLAHSERLAHTRQAKRLVLNTAVRALRADSYQKAIELLEHSRGVFWAMTLQMRSPALNNIPSDERDELRRLFRVLAHGNASSLGGMERAQGERALWNDERGRLMTRVDDVVAKIRLQPGLDRFLLPPAFADISSQMPEGFQVLLLSANEDARCYALVLQGAGGTVRTVELQAMADFVSAPVKNSIPRDFHSTPEALLDEIGTDSALRAIHVGRRRNAFERTLATLWAAILKPVIDALGLQVC